MTTQQIREKVNEKIDGANFDQLVDIFEGLEEAGVYNSDIDDAIMDKMMVVDEEKFIKWSENYEWECRISLPLHVEGLHEEW